MMDDAYVTKLENGAYRVAATRVSLDSVVYAYWRGERSVSTSLRQLDDRI